MFYQPAGGRKAPLLIKVGVVLYGWFWISFAMSYFQGRQLLEATPDLLFAGLTPVFLLGCWGMRKWAAVGFVVQGLLRFGIVWVAHTVLTSRGIVFALAMQATVIVPLALYWRRMTWGAELPREPDKSKSDVFD